MNPVTLRRLLVFGVCAVGVGALYVVPAVTGGSGQVAVPLPDDEPTSQPSRTTTITNRSSDGPDLATASPATTSAPPVDNQDAAARRSPAPRRPTTGFTAYDPRTSNDHEAPEPVTGITTGAVRRDRLTVRWPAATDNVGVLQYRVVLNGFTVATTRKTHATVRWFNDDLSTTVVQVRALDAAGNESASSPNLMVSRPTPEPTPTATPTESASAEPPSPSPTPSDTPTPTPGSSASAEPNGVQSAQGASTPEPSTTAGEH
ncbi:hypothetical protein [uncultured Friedmanniella sp.]|uniref:hypothetical protein n=1 Tax=uncultured Friedmanniella sp. TaxID=335381 RepID=UPI0035CC5C13